MKTPKLTRTEYKELLEDQNYVCAICFGDEPIEKKFSVDHDHDSGEIRGLLCTRCNLGLGLFKDSIETLESATEYLMKTKIY